MYDIIDKKKNGKALSDAEIAFFIKGCTSGEIPDYQTSALLMAICLCGMDGHETAVLTGCMAHSGESLDLSPIQGVTADKHSTGGVGDKTTLIVAPLCAALGLKIAKMSGRGLGHTGGTVDKLESIPGFQARLSKEDFFRQVNELGIAVIGQTGELAPADKKLYALRDVTATVDNYSLIASSIMSKKLAAGDRNIVLDVKCGSGAFMKTPEEARLLARTMVGIGKGCGRNTAAVITDMDSPLGRSVGNSLEVAEAIEILSGGGDERLRTLCLTLAAHMLSLSFGTAYYECFRAAETALKDGSALRKFRALVQAQGGDAAFVDRPDRFPQAAVQLEVKSPESGWIARADARKVGECAVALGAGRERKEDAIDFSAGLRLEKTTGDFAEKGETLAVLHTADERKAEAARELYLSALRFSDRKPEKRKLIYETIL